MEKFGLKKVQIKVKKKFINFVYKLGKSGILVTF